MNGIKYLSRNGKSLLAYANVEGHIQPGVLFLSGFMSTMNGQKALALEEFCRESGHSFVRFDYSGVSDSNTEGSVRNLKSWVEDSIDVFNNLTSGPQVIVGSSMGAFMMMHIAKRFPERVVGMVGVAPSFYFFDHAEKWRKILSSNDNTETPELLEMINMDYFTGMDDLNLFQDKDSKLELPCNLHILQGMKDDVVPWNETLSVVRDRFYDTTTIDLTLRKCGEHRMSRPEDLSILMNVVKMMC
uniref:Serine aminopeptidase S33 domain-containing protein n=2 Tax=Ciona intestinalis TaxID=7719 RepID=F6S3H3_CIOIN